MRFQVQYYGTTGHERELPGGCVHVYISDKGAVIDRRLYLPRSWSKIARKRKKGVIPETIRI